MILDFQNLFFTYRSIYRIKYFLFGLWVILSLIVVFHHEMWRDEMRALSIANLHSSFFDLPQDLKNEGHPILWYIILKIGYGIYPNTLILKIVAYLIGLTSTYLFLFKLRFSTLIAALYVFTNIMFWENTIMCRNYGISSLLIILFFIYYDKKKWLIALIFLALLIQTNIVGVIVSAGLLFILVFRNFKLKEVFKSKELVIGILLILASLLIFYMITNPNELSQIQPFQNKSKDQIIQSIISSLLTPGKILSPFNNSNLYLNTFFLYIFFAYFFKHRILFIAFYLVTVLINFVCLEFYDLSTRHIGVYFTFLLFLFQQRNMSLNIQSIDNYGKYLKIIPEIIQLIFLIILNVSNALLCIDDIKYEQSSIKSISNFISNSKKYSQSILISEPDFKIEALPYYIENKIYFPRENRFGKYSRFTKENKNEMSFGEIIKLSDSFKQKYNAPVLFMVNNIEMSQGKKEFYNYTPKVLRWELSDTLRFHKIKDFGQSLSDENFTLYEIL